MVRADPKADLELEARKVADDLHEGRLGIEPEAESEDLWKIQIEELARRCPGFFEEDYESALRSALPDRVGWARDRWSPVRSRL